MGLALENFISDEDLPTPPLHLLPDPMLWRVLVRPFIPKKRSSGGLVLPDTVVDANALYNIQAKVIKIGPACFRDHQTGKLWDPPVEILPGDTVTIAKFAGQKIEIGQVYFYIINCEEITGRFPPGQFEQLMRWQQAQEELARQARDELRNQTIGLRGGKPAA